MSVYDNEIKVQQQIIDLRKDLITLSEVVRKQADLIESLALIIRSRNDEKQNYLRQRTAKL